LSHQLLVSSISVSVCIGGILIRAIQKCEGKGKKGGELTEGPCNVVNYILTTCGFDHNSGVGQLADNIPLDAFDTSSPLHFVLATNPVDAPVVTSARYVTPSFHLHKGL
jgi:hypothetical protein